MEYCELCNHSSSSFLEFSSDETRFKSLKLIKEELGSRVLAGFLADFLAPEYYKYLEVEFPKQINVTNYYSSLKLTLKYTCCLAVLH